MSIVVPEGAIPAELVKPMVDQYMNRQDIALEELSEQLGYAPDTLRSKLSKEGRLTFDMADRLLCKTGNVLAWYTEPLTVYYKAEQLMPHEAQSRPRKKPGVVQRCEAPGCHKTFEYVKARGHSRRRYCSRTCRDRHYKQKRGAAHKEHDRRMTRNGRKSLKCRHGHLRTPENTQTLKDGSIRCRICQRARTQECRERKRAAA